MRRAIALSAFLVLAPGLLAAQVDTPEARVLLRESIEEAHRAVGCRIEYSSDLIVNAFFARMDAIAEEKFAAAGLTFPASTEDRDAAFLPVYEQLFAEGLIIEEKEGDVELFPSACEDN